MSILGVENLNGQILFNPNILPLGETEALMGNTGIGGVGSPAAVFYNPGALAMLEGSSFSLSASAYTRYRFSAKPEAVVFDTELDLEAQGFRSLPTSIVMVRKVGDWRIGAYALYVSDFSYEGQEIWEVPFEGAIYQFTTKINYRETLAQFGLSAARPFGEGWMAGISLAAQNFSLLNSQDGNSFVNLENTPFFYESIRQKVSSTGLLLTAGLLKTWDKWNLGVRISAPSIDVLESGEDFDLVYNSGPIVQLSRTDLKGQYKSPWELGLGVVYHPNNHWKAAVDLTARTGVDYALFQDVEGTEIIRTKANYRINGGVQFRPGERFGYHLGANFTPSTLDESAEEVALEFIGFYGGIKLFTEHLETSVGFFINEGRGEEPLPNSSNLSKQSYEFLGLFIGSNYRF
ncbi:MAG: hypothetical protein WBA74_05010 [Cyclobacteriaceae bacterium]